MILAATVITGADTSVVSLIIIIIVAVFTSVTAPLILAHRNEKMHREDRLADYKRQDEAAAAAKNERDEVAAKAEQAAADLKNSQKQIADQAAEAAQLLLEAQKESITRTDEVARVAAVAQASAADKLEQLDLQTKRIHTLVNSDMTAARQSELDQTRAMVVVLRRIIDLAPHTNPDSRDLLALSAAEMRITDLEAILADRLAQMRLVEAEQVANPIRDDEGRGK